jgi:hypothetical protein
MKSAYIIFCNDIPYFVILDDYDTAISKMGLLKYNHLLELYCKNDYIYTDYKKEYNLKYIWHIHKVEYST